MVLSSCSDCGIGLPAQIIIMLVTFFQYSNSFHFSLSVILGIWKQTIKTNVGCVTFSALTTHYFMLFMNCQIYPEHYVYMDIIFSLWFSVMYRYFYIPIYLYIYIILYGGRILLHLLVYDFINILVSRQFKCN